MPQRHPFEIDYRGQTYAGEWYVEDGRVHVASRLGYSSAPVATALREISRPPEVAAGLLTKLALANDPNPLPWYRR